MTRRIRRMTRRAATGLTLVVLPVLCASSHARAAVPQDHIRLSPALERHAPRRIALLPVVGFVLADGVTGQIERDWHAHYAEDGHAWLPASSSRELMDAASLRPDSLVERVGTAVRRAGHVDPALAIALTRLLGVEAVMSVRVDRWDRMAGRAMVELTASLVDSSGRLLWQINGTAGDGRTRPGMVLDLIPASGAPADPMTGLRPIGEVRVLTPLSAESGTPEHALDVLLARWAPALPDAPTAAGSEAEGMIASGHASPVAH